MVYRIPYGFIESSLFSQISRPRQVIRLPPLPLLTRARPYSFSMPRIVLTPICDRKNFSFFAHSRMPSRPMAFLSSVHWYRTFSTNQYSSGSIPLSSMACCHGSGR